VSIEIRDQLGIRGRFQLQVFGHDGELIDEVDEWNAILDVGLVALIEALLLPPAGTAVDTFFAIGIGDDGALATDPMIPKVIDPTLQVALFHELGARTNTGFTSAAIAGTDPAVFNAIQLQQTFTAGNYVDGDFLDTTKKYLNEAVVFLGKTADATSAWNEFSMRTFKSIPFGPADAVTALIRWTFEFQRGTV
jgi:hypothetical protein